MRRRRQQFQRPAPSPSPRAAGGSGPRDVDRRRSTVTVTVTDVAPPAKPAAPTFGTATATSIVVNWLAPASPGAVITDYDVRVRQGTAGEFLDGGRPRRHGRGRRRITPTVGERQSYQVRVRAKNAEGESDWSDARQFTAAENTAPAFAAGELRLHAGRERRREHDGHRARQRLGDRRGQRPHGRLLHRGGQHRRQVRHRRVHRRPDLCRPRREPRGDAEHRAHRAGRRRPQRQRRRDGDRDGDRRGRRGPRQAPAAPEVSATADSLTSIDVSWTAPMNAGPAIGDYDVEYRQTGTTDWTSHAHVGAATATAIAGLAGGHGIPGPGAGAERGGHGRLVGPGLRLDRSPQRAGAAGWCRPSATRPRPASWSTGWSPPTRARPSPTTTCGTKR